jgi:predicted nucleic acid-binding protein
MRLVADTDFLSALHKIERIGLIYEVFGVDRIYVTQAVIDELSKASFFYDFIRKTEKIERVVVDEVPSHIKSVMLGKGETDFLCTEDKIHFYFQ